eukprot:COSAG02_NODE_5568_length_4225_cov_1.651478_3_plen_938_part_00
MLRAGRAGGGGGGSGRVVVGEYQLAGKLGRGGSGVVHKAIHVLKGHIVAVKLISVATVPKEEISSIEMEIKLMRDLCHPNIVKYIDSKQEGSELCIVLEYVEGGSLAKIMHDVGQGTLPATLVALYLSKMLRGLVYLHSEGVIHRDVKAANILVDRDGEVRLADFGVAISTRGRAADGAAGGGGMTDVVGTPYWMAPEVIEMSGATDRSDVWSVGCTVIELLTGAPPYADLPQVPALFRIVQDLHPPLPDLAAQDPALHDFLMRCFQKDPQDRAAAHSLSEHRWLVEMRQSIDETISHDVETADGATKNAWPLDEESEEDDDDTSSVGRPQANLVPHTHASEAGSSTFSGSAAASTVVSPGQQQQQQQQNHRHHQHEKPPQGAGLTSTISMHRELSDTIRSGRSSIHGGRGSLRFSRSGSSGGSGRWEPMATAEQGQDASMTSLSSLSALASGVDPPAASGHSVASLGSSPFQVGAGTVPSSIRPDSAQHRGYGRARADPSYDGVLSPSLQGSKGSTSSYSYAQAGPQDAREGEEGSAEGSHGGGVIDNAAAAAAALEVDIQPQATEDWEQALDGSVSASLDSSTSIDGGNNVAPTIEDEDDETKEARRWIEQLKAPSRSGGGSSSVAPASPVVTRDDSHHQACVALVTLFVHSPAKKSCLITQHAIIALMEILEKGMEGGNEGSSSQLKVQVAAMILINQVSRADPNFQEKLCLVGVLPLIVQLGKSYGEASFKFAGVSDSGEEKVRVAMAKQLLAEVVRFVAEICRPDSSSLALQMFIACQGLTVLTSLLTKEGLFVYPASPAEAAEAAAAAAAEGLSASPTASLGQKTLMHLVIDSIWHIFDRTTAGRGYGSEKGRGRRATQQQLTALLPNLDICRLFVKAGLLEPLSLLLCRWIRTGEGLLSVALSFGVLMQSAGIVSAHSPQLCNTWSRCNR